MHYQGKTYLNYNYVANPILQDLNMPQFSNSFNYDSKQIHKFSFKQNKVQHLSEPKNHVGHVRTVSVLTKESDQLTFDKQYNLKQTKLKEQKNDLSGKQIADGTCKIFLLALLIPLFLGALYAVLYVTARKKVSLTNSLAQSVNLLQQNGILQKQNIQSENSSISYVQSSAVTTPSILNLPTKSQMPATLNLSLNFIDAIPILEVINISSTAAPLSSTTHLQENNDSSQNTFPQTKVQTRKNLNQEISKIQSDAKQMHQVENLFDSKIQAND